MGRRREAEAGHPAAECRRAGGGRALLQPAPVGDEGAV